MSIASDCLGWTGTLDYEKLDCVGADKESLAVFSI
jgi:hypothetical protein